MAGRRHRPHAQNVDPTRGNVVLSTRVDPDEMSAIEHAAAGLAMSKSTYVRQRVLGDKMRHADKTQALVRALSACGNNLNQLAKVAHRSGQVAQVEALAPVLSDLTSVLRQLGRKRP